MSNYAKLKTNLKLSIQRLKLAEKKKSIILENYKFLYFNFKII